MRGVPGVLGDIVTHRSPPDPLMETEKKRRQRICKEAQTETDVQNDGDPHSPGYRGWA